jgi:hypothetical protein
MEDVSMPNYVIRAKERKVIISFYKSQCSKRNKKKKKKKSTGILTLDALPQACLSIIFHFITNHIGSCWAQLQTVSKNIRRNIIQPNIIRGQAVRMYLSNSYSPDPHDTSIFAS